MGSNINPHDAQWLTWWEASPGGTHQNLARQYGDEWVEFLDSGSNGYRTDDEIVMFAFEQAEKYKKHYWNERYYFELYRLKELPGSGSHPFGYKSRHD